MRGHSTSIATAGLIEEFTPHLVHAPAAQVLAEAPRRAVHASLVARRVHLDRREAPAGGLVTHPLHLAGQRVSQRAVVVHGPGQHARRVLEQQPRPRVARAWQRPQHDDLGALCRPTGSARAVVRSPLAAAQRRAVGAPGRRQRRGGGRERRKHAQRQRQRRHTPQASHLLRFPPKGVKSRLERASERTSAQSHTSPSRRGQDEAASRVRAGKGAKSDDALMLEVIAYYLSRVSRES